MLEKIPESIGQALQGRRAGLTTSCSTGSTCARARAPDSDQPRLCGSRARYRHAIPPMPKARRPHRPWRWQDVPAGTDTLALVVEDADSPTSEPLVHAIAVDVAPARKSSPKASWAALGRISTQHRTQFLSAQSWLPPDPPPGHGVHRYAFQLFALAPGNPFSAAPGRGELSTAIRERGIASGCMIGTYERSTRISADEPQRTQQPLAEPLSAEMATGPGGQPIGVGAPMSAGPELL